MKHVFSLAMAILFLTSASGEARETIRTPVLDFKDAFGQDMTQWLKDKGFTLEQSADNPRKARFTATEGGMVMEALSPAQAILMFKKGSLTNYRDVELTWGVNQYPAGANWDKGRRNEAVMFYAFFGTERIDSGSTFIPDSPYFIAIRLCENDTAGVLHKGGYFHKGGRFICIARPKPGEVITTTFDLRAAFREAFGKNPPPLSAIGLEFDTSQSGNKGKSSATVEKIVFPAATYIRD